MMRQKELRKPSLSALRAFEAAARLGSIRKAALELQIDHAVVSRHLRDVQAELAVQLVEKHPNKFALTAQGAAFSNKLSHGFSCLNAAVADLRDETRISSLSIRCNHGFANN